MTEMDLLINFVALTRPWSCRAAVCAVAVASSSRWPGWGSSRRKRAWDSRQDRRQWRTDCCTDRPLDHSRGSQRVGSRIAPPFHSQDAGSSLQGVPTGYGIYNLGGVLYWTYHWDPYKSQCSGSHRCPASIPGYMAGGRWCDPPDRSPGAGAVHWSPLAPFGANAADHRWGLEGLSLHFRIPGRDQLQLRPLDHPLRTGDW